MAVDVGKAKDDTPVRPRRPSRIVVLVSRLDPAIPSVRDRGLVPASVLRGGGHRVDIVEKAPSRERLRQYDAILLIDPREPEDLRCADEAAWLGLAIIADIDASALSANSVRRDAVRSDAIGRSVIEVATIVTTARAETAARLTALAPSGVDVTAIPNCGEDSIGTAAVLREFQRDLRAARVRRLVSELQSRWLSRRSPLAAPLRILGMARLVPIAQWPSRVPRALARRTGAWFAGKSSQGVSAVIAQPRSSPAVPAKVPALHRSASPPSAAALIPSGQPASFVPVPVTADREALAAQWRALVDDALLKVRTSEGRMRRPRMRVMAFMDLIQDLDVLLPIFDRVRTDARFALSVVVTDWLNRVSPRVSRELLQRSIIPEIVTKEDVIGRVEPELARINALITACESSHPAHRVPFALVLRANARGIPTYTFQHGLENIGLTYFGPDPKYKGLIEFASASILTWGPVDQLPAEVTASIRTRCFGVGTPKPSEALRIELPLPPLTGPVVAVFENLHWQRYSEAYRLAFMRDLCAVAAARPTTTFLIKPHHAGQYLSKNRHLLADAPANMILADPTGKPWEPYTAGSIIGSVDAIVTTPSTVALDAARAGCPVAVAGYDLSLPIYEPLPILSTSDDWFRFIAGITDGSADLGSKLARFRERHVIQGDAVDRILNKIAADVERVTEPTAKLRAP